MHIFLLAQTQAEAGPAPWTMLIWLLIIPLMYFMIIRPNNKRQKEAKSFRDALKAGDAVISAGGMFGIIKEVDDKTVLLEVTPKTRIRVLRSQIVSSQPSLKPDAKSSSDTVKAADVETEETAS